MLLRQDEHTARIGKQYRRHDELYLLLLLSVPIVSTNPRQLLMYSAYALGVILLVLLFLMLYSLRWPKARKIQVLRASAFQPDAVPKNLDTIVIGSGSGGSACANLLAKSGQRVLVLEQHKTVTGGCTHSFREQNCEWDTGLHYTSKDMSLPTARPGKFHALVLFDDMFVLARTDSPSSRSLITPCSLQEPSWIL